MLYHLCHILDPLYAKKKELFAPVKIFVHIRVGHYIIRVDEKMGVTGPHFEMEGSVGWQSGSPHVFRGSESSTFPHTRTLASPSHGHAWVAWHGIIWEGVPVLYHLCHILGPV